MKQQTSIPEKWQDEDGNDHKENIILSLYYAKQLGEGIGYEQARYWYHDPETNFKEKGVTHHIIDDRTHRCIWCGKLDHRGIVPFLHIMGSC